MTTSAIDLDAALAAPLETLLSSGGDHRQRVDHSTGLNRYRVSGKPRDGVPLGSCTASWPSDLGFAAAGRALEGWREHPGGALEALTEATSSVRRRLGEVFDLDERHKIVLTPSGTDAIFVVSALVLARSERSVHHLLVGAGELGSGSLGAARGDAFTSDPPLGSESDLDSSLLGLGDHCTAQAIYLRSSAGELLEPAMIDASVTAAVEAAVDLGATVVIHMVAHSKTGLRAPSVHQISKLVERFGERVVVVMDAAQGRVAPVDIRRALNRDFLVLFTGSKFYSGPPFSGALLLPPAWGADPGTLPEGLREWLAATDLPISWTEARGSLEVPANAGLALRWENALTEIEAYHAIPPEHRSQVYHMFAAAMLGTFGPARAVELIIPTPPVHELASGLGAFPSVFSLVVSDESGRRLGMDELARLHVGLDTPIESEEPALRCRFHLGQPVALGPPQDEPAGVLRVALGARLVREHADSPDSGAQWFRDRAEELLYKITTLVAAGCGRP